MDIVIERGKVTTLKSLPEYSIALDGFVQGPQIDDTNHRYSFDHHDGCSRFATLSACEQAWNAIMLGLDPDEYTIYCNDVDADVCAAIWCLKNPDRCKEPIVKKLIDAIGMSDRYAGAAEINGMKKVVEWVCAPETESKKNGDYEVLSDDGLKPILESILHRMDQVADGISSIEVAKQNVTTDYTVVSNNNGWSLIETHDPHALGAIWQAGFDRIIVARPQKDKTIAYTIAKRSQFIENFPIDKFFKALNETEEGWGGGDTIGGAPRHPDGSRSKLSHKQVSQVIDDVLNGTWEPAKKPRKTSTSTTATAKATTKAKTKKKTT